MESACIITIWGYSAPKSDVEAKRIMLNAFSSVYRPLDQIEVIDIADSTTIYDTWRPFAENNNYHLKIYKSLLDSLISEFPRRSVEGYVKRNIEGWWNNPLVQLKTCVSFDELSQLFEPLLANEKQGNYDVV